MKIIYIYHSCYLIEADNCSILIDFYKDTISARKGYIYDTLLKSEGVLYILISHSHLDHFNRDILEWRKKKKNIKYLFSSDILESHLVSEADGCILSEGEIYIDNTIKIQAYGSTDIGISFLIEIDKKRIFHAGDFNIWQKIKNSTVEEIKIAEDQFLYILDNLVSVIGKLDVAMFPLDPRVGIDCFRGARHFLEKIETIYFLPMHFADWFEAITLFQEIASKYETVYCAWEKRGDYIII